MQACQGSLRRLNTGWIDLYLLHWRGPVPLAETLEAFRDLRNAGLIRNWGVSNFDVSDLDDLMSLPGSSHVATDQVLKNLSPAWAGVRPVPGLPRARHPDHGVLAGRAGADSRQPGAA